MDYRLEVLLVGVEVGYFLPHEVVVDLEVAEPLLDEFELNG